ncbi:hypothetical protein FRB96_009141 [Tulasnella sp. 330]|nr:hypothetical protein FRB96_009141 [Tulasnella sp. 330]KAG8877896.1 hypothetical protein FRB97_002930 [Tulasnella sp. 331]KAG8886892.1 hypothetical protein FRB98_000808 [Tulasnella sp. 332]
MATTNLLKRKASDDLRYSQPHEKLPKPEVSPLQEPEADFSMPGVPNFVIPAAKFRLQDTFSEALGKSIKKRPDLDLVLYKSYFNAKGAKLLFQYLLSSLPWYRVKYKARGMDVTTPRFTTVFGKDDTSTPISSSSYKRTPRPIPPILSALKAYMEEAAGPDKTFNFVLVNYYSDGNDSITYHSDDEAFLGPNPTIASVSLGGSRDFYLKHKTLKARAVEKFVLDSGDMILMQNQTQTSWLHSVPKRTSASPRINITFRKAINPAGTNNYYRYNVGDGPVYRYVDGKMTLPSA